MQSKAITAEINNKIVLNTNECHSFIITKDHINLEIGKNCI